MAIEKGSKRVYFPNVKYAREILRERANEILESYLAVAAEARAEKDFETAAGILWKLIEHMPEEDGARMIDSSAAKPKEIASGPTGPQIQIGIKFDNSPKQLPSSSEVIEIAPEPKDE